MPDEAMKQLYLHNVVTEVRLSKLQTELEAQRRQNESLMKQLSAMRVVQDDLDASEKDNNSLRSKITILKLKLKKAKSERDRINAQDRAAFAQDRSALERLIRVNTIVSSGTAMIEGRPPKSRMEVVLQTHSAPGDSATARASSHYRGNHPGASKFMRCIRSFAAAGPETMECQRDDIIYINYGEKDLHGMVHAVSYNGKMSGKVPWGMLEPVVSSRDLADGFDPEHLHGSVDPANFSLYSSPASETISPAHVGLDGFPYGPSRGGGATITRIGESSPSGRSSRLTRDRVNQTVTYHTESEQIRREQRAASPPPKKSWLTAGCFCCGPCCCCC